jgi:CheY-like chemotaxis protein
MERVQGSAGGGEKLVLDAGGATQTGAVMTKSVLVVDDDRQMLDLMHVMLTRAGYEVVLADGAVPALEVLERQAVSAVVLDIMMPVRSGIEVLEHIRWNPKLANLPVIILSAAHLSAEDREFVDEFAIAFVDKARISELLERLAALFAEA